MTYYLSVMFHWLFMLVYYTLVTLGWCLEMVMIFVAFFIGGFLLGRI